MLKNLLSVLFLAVVLPAVHVFATAEFDEYVSSNEETITLDDGTSLTWNYNNDQEKVNDKVTFLGKEVSAERNADNDQYMNDYVKKLESTLDDSTSNIGQNWSSIVSSEESLKLTFVNLKPRYILKREDTCPEKRYVLRYYWETSKRICRVVRPYYQYITYVKCTYKPCCKETKSICIRDGWTRHRFLVLCYNVGASSSPELELEWKTVIRYFPKCCDCHEYQYLLRG